MEKAPELMLALRIDAANCLSSSKSQADLVQRVSL